MVGTTADRVDYTNTDMSGVANVKGALDAINDRLKDVEDGEIGGVLNDLITLSGAKSGKWETYRYAYPQGMAVGSTFDPTSFTAADSYSHCAFRVMAGDTLHYADIGDTGLTAYVLTDTDNKIVAISSAGLLTGTESVTVDGYCYAVAYVTGNRAPVIYASWSDRPTLKSKKGVLCVLGDSISTEGADIRYPSMLAQMLNCELDLRAQGGSNLEGALGNSRAVGYRYLRSDADYVVVLYGANDATFVNSIPVGDADDVMELDIDDDATTLKSTFIGRYRYLVAKLRAMMAKNAKIFCIGPLLENNEPAALATMRTEISDLVSKMGGGANGYYYIHGPHCLEYVSAFFLDQTHPNLQGHVVLANTIFAHIKKKLG